MGSVGQYAGEKSFIKDVVIENMWMLNGQHSARIKTWAGPNVGYGFVDNITFRNFWNANNEYAGFLDSCYFNASNPLKEDHMTAADQTRRLTRAPARSIHHK